MEAARTLKRRSTIILHGSTSQKTILNFILAAVRTSNITYYKVTNNLFSLISRAQLVTHSGINWLKRERIVGYRGLIMNCNAWVMDTYEARDRKRIYGMESNK
jgi:hypothetical protein